MRVKHKIYFRSIYMAILFLGYYIGIKFYKTPMKSYTYAIFLLIYLYYYLSDFLEFRSGGARFKPWILSLIINLLMASFLWTFSKSYLLFFKFFIFWIYSNLLREVLLRFRAKELKAIFVGSEEKFQECTRNSKRNFFNFVARIEAGSKNGEILEYISREEIEAIIIEEEVAKSYPKEFLNLKLKGIKVFFPWQYKESVDRKIDVKEISDRWFLYSQGFDILSDTFERKIKRGVDILAAIGVGVFAVPLIGISALMMKLMGMIDKKTAGPVFFKQVRVGLGNESFEIIKFRTMITKEHWKDVGFDPNIEAWTEEEDPRITKLGKFMRKTRIDELPQLINVFRGEMSFVGPRPESVPYVKILEEEIPFYALRHTVLPGLTGWAQVMYPYGASVEDALHKLEYDLFYIKHQTFVMDLMIFFKTVKTVIFGMGR